LNDVRGRLNQLNQNALTAKWKCIIALGVNKNNIVACRAFAYAPGGKA
jgi:hypothetical protein